MVAERIEVARAGEDRACRAHGDPPRPRAAAGELPRTVHVCLTERCNLRCLHCDLWSKAKTRELDLLEWERIVVSLKDRIGPFCLKIAGGEPLVRSGLAGFVARCKSIGLTVGLSSNGWALGPRLVDDLRESGLDELLLSVDSLVPEVHDAVRRHSGLHGRCLEAIARLGREGPPRVCISTVLMDLNLSEWLALARWADSGAVYNINFQPMLENFGRPHRKGWWRDHPLFPRDRGAAIRALEAVIEMKTAGSFAIANPVAMLRAFQAYFDDPDESPRRCQAGQTDIALDPAANVGLCFNLPPIGNLLESPLDAILAGPRAERRRSDVAGCRRPCSVLNCHYLRDGSHG